MIIKTLFFGITTDLVNASQLDLKVDDALTIKEFKSVLMNLYPQLSNLNSYAIAVNEEYATDDLILKETDVIAIIPPVSGG